MGTAELRRDMLILLALFALSSALYVGQLGFYSDDWSFLYTMQAKAEPSWLASVARIVREDLPTRPGQAILLVTLFRSFGLAPTPYHFFNLVVTGLAVVLFYVSARCVGVARLFALPAAALYGLLPLYSTDRFWVSAFQAPVSMVFFFASLLAGLRAVTSERPWRWGVIALAAQAGSILSYEVAVPLMVASAWLWWQRAEVRSRARPVMMVAVSLVLVIALSAWKALGTNRMAHEGGWPGYVWWIVRTAINPFYTREHAGLNVYYALFTNYLQDGLLLPWSAWKTAVANVAGGMWLPGLVSLAAGAVLFAAVYRVARRSEARAWQQAGLTMLSGFGIFWLGYAIFLTNGNVQFSPTGIANRTAIAAAVGVVLWLAGAAAFVTRWFRTAWRPLIYSLPIAVMGACGCFIVNSLASSWAEAYQRELQVLHAVTAASPGRPPGGTILLDGVCPYLGPAPVFESSWDFSGALSLRYRTPKYLLGDIVTPHLSVQTAGLHVVHYAGEEYLYPYANDLVIFRAQDSTLHRIADQAAADRYFEQAPASGCGRSEPGLGETIY